MSEKIPSSRHELNRVLNDALSDTPPAAVDVKDVIARGRRRRSRRVVRIGVLGTACAVLVAGVVGVALRAQSDQTSLPAASASRWLDDKQLAELFAFRALDAAGLRDLDGDFYGIGDLQATDGGWTVDLSLASCVANDVVQTCVPKVQDAASLLVQVSDAGFAVADAEGVDAGARGKLLNYHHDLADLPNNDPYWVFSQPQVLGEENLHVDTLIAWAGPIPHPGVAVECRAELLDSEGAAQWQSEWKEVPPPSSEVGRFGGSIGWIDVPAELRDAERRVECRSFEAGWELAHGQDNVRVDETASPPVAQLSLVWGQEPYLQVYTRCDVVVTDESNRLIAQGAQWMIGPSREQVDSPPPYEQTATVLLEGSLEGAANASATCVPVSPAEYEGRDQSGSGPSDPRPSPPLPSFTPLG
jgi:hypothetical protein